MMTIMATPGPTQKKNKDDAMKCRKCKNELYPDRDIDLEITDHDENLIAATMGCDQCGAQYLTYIESSDFIIEEE